MLFLQNCFTYVIRTIHKFGVRNLHLANDSVHHLMHERLLLSKQATMPNAAAKNLSQHVAAAFVRRVHTIGNQKRRGSRVVGDDAERRGRSCIAESQPR